MEKLDQKKEEFFGTYSHMRDIQPGHIWDSLSLEKGDLFHTDGIKLFSVPVGHPKSDGTYKTLADTSMSQSCMLPLPQQFYINKVIFTFSNNTIEEDLVNIVEGFVWRLWLQSKWYLSSPLISLQMIGLPKAPIRICKYCHSVWVQDKECPGCGAREFRFSDTGEEVGKGFVMELGKGNELVILQGMSFHVDFQGNDFRVRSKVKMWCHFEGLLARGVQ